MFRTLLIALFAIVLTSANASAQDLDLSDFELKANFPLSSDGVDASGHYGDMKLTTPFFDYGGIFSWGCWVGTSGTKDSCLIATQQIDALNERAFVIQLDFSLSTLGLPIFQAGSGYRYLGLQTSTSGTLKLKTGSQAEEEIEDVTLNVDEWYTATVIHNTHDSTTKVYINDELVYTKKKFLDHPANDNIISNTDYSRGKAFFGYWKNLKVYSTDNILSVEDDEIISETARICPNPAHSFIRLNMDFRDNTDYFISNSLGARVLSGKLNSNKSIDIQDLPTGVYNLRIDNKGYKFIKN